MSEPIRLAVIGGGQHSLKCHLPALARYQVLQPGGLTIAAVVDRVAEKARTAADRFSIPRAYADVDEMLRHERPGACLALTPVALNAELAIKLMRLGIPVLMEKPLGETLGQAREVVRVASETDARVMVSMNRRFDPQIQGALAWIGTRTIRYIRATMARYNRHEDRFLEETGVHVIDVIRMIGGEAKSWSSRRNSMRGDPWTQVRIDFADGACGLVDLLPTTGGDAEVIELFGADFSVEIRSAESDRSWRAWSEGKLVREVVNRDGSPEFIANGTYAETVAFIEQLASGRPLRPSPADILPSMEICHSVSLDEGEIKPESVLT